MGGVAHAAPLQKGSGSTNGSRRSLQNVLSRDGATACLALGVCLVPAALQEEVKLGHQQGLADEQVNHESEDLLACTYYGSALRDGEHA